MIAFSYCEGWINEQYSAPLQQTKHFIPNKDENGWHFIRESSHQMSIILICLYVHLGGGDDVENKRVNCVLHDDYTCLRIIK